GSGISPRGDSSGGKGRIILFVDVFCGSGRGDFSQQEIAAPLAITARLGAKLAMGVLRRVSRAFVEAALAGNHAGVELRVDEIVWGFGLAEQESRGDIANVRAIQISGDAPAQISEVLRFGKTGVGAQGTSVTACAQGRQCFGIVFRASLVGSRVALKHRFQRTGFHDRS
ncbi:MAG: hypothetical protein ABIZ81_09785, partial [Opitutaceae bacterium]